MTKKILLFILLILSFTVSAQIPETEPNNIYTSTGVQTILANGDYSGVYTVGDLEYYLLPPGASGTITVTFTNAPTNNSIYLNIYGGANLASTSNPGTFTYALNPAVNYMLYTATNSNTGAWKFNISGLVVPGSALHFNNAYSKATVPGISINNRSFTIEFWAKRNSNNTSDYVIGQGASVTGTNVSLHIGFRPAPTNQFTFAFYSNDINVTSPAVTDGLYHHWACVYKSGVSGINRFVYLDGALIGCDSSPSDLLSTGDFIIGDAGYFSNPFDGLIDEVRIWNYARTQCEIQTYMNCEIPDAATGLLANYHFNQGVYSGNNTAITTLTDASGNGRHAVLDNFAMTGTTSNFTGPGGVANNYSTTNTPQPEINIMGNGSNILNNTTATSLSNYTDFGPVNTRTFVIQNTGSTVLNLNPAYLTGADAASFSITSIPAATVAAGGTASFAVTFTPISFGTKTATININNNDCDEPLYNFVITAASSQNALHFDGINDYVTMGNQPSTIFPGTSPYTIEAWIKRKSGTGGTIVGMHNQGINSAWKLDVQADGSLLSFRNISPSILTAPNVVPGDVWTHIATTYNGTVLNIYVNGVIVATRIFNPIGNSTLPLMIGAGLNNGVPSNFFTGSIDEVRIFNFARSTLQIVTDMSVPITGSEFGLVTSYDFNRGMPDGANAGYTTASSLPAGMNGTLNNFGLIGCTSNYVCGAPDMGGCPRPEINVQGNSVDIVSGSATTSTVDYTYFGQVMSGATLTRTFVIQNTGNGTLNLGTTSLSGATGDFQYTTPAAQIAPGSSSQLVLTFAPTTTGLKTAVINISNDDCDENPYTFAVEGTCTFPAEALDFDGINDYVQAPNIPALLLTNALSLEAWVKPVDNANIYYVVTKGTDDGVSGQYGLVLLNGIPQLHMFRSAPAIAVESTLAITPGVWTHIAGSWDGSVMRMYVNGILRGTKNYSGTMTTNTGPLRIGRLGVVDYYFKGSIDEVRVWNTARSQCEIQSYMNAEATSTLSGLVACYHFNQGAAGAINTGTTSLTDASASGNTGTLNNFALSGATSNWISPGGVATGNTVQAVPAGTLQVLGNGAIIANGATASGTANFTDFGTAFTRTFVATNTAAGGTLYINSVTISGANAADFSVTTAPSSSITGGGSSNFVISFNPPAIGTRSAVVIVSTSGCAAVNYSFVITASATPASALSFENGGYITTTGHTLNNQSFSIEFYAKRNSSADGDFIYSQGSSNTNDGLHIGFYPGNDFIFDFWNSAITVQHFDNLWHHWACVYDATATGNNWFIYRDGLVAASSRFTGTYTGTGTSYIGTTPWDLHDDQFTGNLDELRIWGVARSQCDIQTYMNCEIPASAPGLISNYHFNQGISSANNSNITFLADASATPNNGTLHGFALTGSTSNWVSPGAVANGYTVTAQPAVEIDLNSNGNPIAAGSATTSLANNTNFGGACINAPVTKTYTIQNTGSAALALNSGTITGPDAALFTLGTLPVSIAANSSAVFTITLSASSAGVKNATVNITSNDCDEALYTFAITGSVSPSPTITTSNGMICSGQSYTLTASGASTYTYSGGQVVSPVSSTNYSITGTSADGCAGSNTAVATVIVNAIPPVSVSGTGTICSSGNSNFTASGAVTYTWSTGDTGPMVTLSPTITTTYTVTGAYANGCSNTAVKTLSVYTTPTISVNSGTICYGQSFTIAPTGAATYSYMNGGPVVSPTVITSYSLTGTSAQGCTSFPESISTVSVIPLPTLSIINYAVCSGNSVNLNPSGAVSYTFQGGSASVSPTTTTTYTVAGSNALGCVATATTTVTVYNSPTLSIAASNTAICEGAAATLTVSGAMSYFWSNAATTNTVSVSPVTSTIYSVTGIDANSCSSSISQSITVNALPTITVPNGTICPGNSFTLNPSGANTYAYSSGTNVVSPSSTTTYSISGTSTAGCVSSASAVATVYVINTLTVSVTGNTTICNGQTTTLTAGGATSYSWTNGTTSASVALSPSVNTTYTVYGVSGTCSNNAVVSVSVNATPTISVNSGTICAGQVFTMNPSGAVNYVYSSTSNTVSPLVYSTYSVSGTGANGCVSTTSAISTVSVNALPTLTIATTSTAVCSGSSATLTASGAVTYTWSNALQTSTINVLPTANTGYTVTGTDANGCIGSTASTIVVNALPTITVPNGTICPGNSFTLNPSGANSYAYSSGTNVVSPSSTTTYSISGTSTAGCVSSASAIATVNVINSLTVTVTGNTLICNGQTTTLTAGGATTYSWTNGALTSTVALSPTANTTYTVYGVSGTCSNNAVVSVSVNATPTISVNSGTICAGQVFTMNPSGAVNYVYSSTSNTVSPLVYTTYSVSGTGANGCVSTTSAISTVSVNALPTLTIATTSTAVCSGSSATLTASGALNYLWSNAATTSTIGVTPAANTGYTVTGTDANGCTGFTTQLIAVNPLPTISLNGGAICPGASFTLNPSGASTYTFSGGNAIVSPLANTDYSVAGTSALGCVSSISAVATVSVVSTLTVSVSGATTICSGQTATLTAGGATTYSWSTGVTTDSITLSPSTTTDYTVYAFSGSCMDKALVTVSVNPLPAISVSSGTVCSGSSFTLNPSGAVSYSYTGGSAVVSPTINTSYSVTGTDANGCVSASPAVASITVSALPALTMAISEPSVCAGATTQVSASGANTYSWSTAATTASITVTPSTTAVYSVTGTDILGCSNTGTIEAVVKAMPTLTLTKSQPGICMGGSVTMTVSGADTYTWSTGSASSTIVISPSVTSTYSVTGTLQGCEARAVETISIFAQPTLAISGVATICKKGTAMITASGATTYSWSNGETSALVALSPSANTTYTVTGSNSHACSDTATFAITVDKTCTDSLLPVKIFSGITPNGDNVNDFWNIKNIEDYPKNRVTVYNRWGMVVAEISGYDNANRLWPTADEAGKLSPSTYYYIIELGDGSKPIKGWVEIVKD